MKKVGNIFCSVALTQCKFTYNELILLPLKWSDEGVCLAESLQNLLARKVHCIDKNVGFYSWYFGANVISGYVAYE